MRLILVYLALIPMVCLAQDQSSNAAKPGMAAAGAAWMRIVRVDKMDDQAQTAYRVQALSDDHRSADILYLCKAGQLLGGIYNANVALAVDHVYGEQDFVDMQYRKDHFMPGEGWWSRTSDGSSLVIPQGQLRKMLEGQTLLIRATTVGGSVVEDERHGPTHVREGLRRPTMKRLLPPGRYLILCSLFCFAAPALAGSAPNEADYPTQYSVVNAIKLDSAWLASALGYDHLREGTI
jgi:hypothetical protein